MSEKEPKPYQPHQKAVLLDGPRLLPGLIVRYGGRLVEGRSLLYASQRWSPSLALRERSLDLSDPLPRARFRSECNFWRFASSHLREYFPKLLSQLRVRALGLEMRALQCHLADLLV